MTSCELCGRDVDSLKKVKIEGATLKACDSCSEMGEEVKTSTKKKRTKKSTRSKRSSEDVLINGYGEKLKNAREDKQLSIAEVADDLNEKESLIAKIEKEDLKPDKPLADKLSKKFGITLYTNPEVSNYDTQDNVDDRKATMEDVADIK